MIKIKKLINNGNDKKSFYSLFNKYNLLKILFKKNKKIIIFDVGANEGQSIVEFIKHFPKSNIHSFEPVVKCREKLEYLKNKFNKNKIHLNFYALGKIKKKIFFNECYSTNLSSFYKINKKSKYYIKLRNPKNRNLKKFQQYKKIIHQETLKNYIMKNNINKINVLKIDTQGYDSQVIEGIGKKNFKKIDIIITEVMLSDFYKINRKNDFYFLYNLLYKNFKLWDISYIYKNPKFLGTDYFDAVFINNNFRSKVLS